MPELHALSVAPQPSREASAGQEGGRRDGQMPAEERVGVLLLNLGGPETLDDVQPFLYNLFADDSIIRLPPYGGPFAPHAPSLAACRCTAGFLRIVGCVLGDAAKQVAKQLSRRLAAISELPHEGLGRTFSGHGVMLSFGGTSL